jgi:hypothetical protein
MCAQAGLPASSATIVSVERVLDFTLALTSSSHLSGYQRTALITARRARACVTGCAVAWESCVC